MAGEALEFQVEQHALATMVQKWQATYGKVVRAIEPDYLQCEPYRWFIKKFQEFLKKNDRVIPWDYLDVQIRRDFQDANTYQEMRSVLYVLYSTEITWGDEAVQSFREYLAWRTFSAGIRDVQTGFKKSRTMTGALGHARQVLDKSIVLLTDAKVHDLLDDFEEREAAWIRYRDNPHLSRRLKLGIPELDAQTKFDAGTLNAFLAPFGRGKSIMLNHVGVCGLAQGFNVLHVTCENSVEQTEDRYYSRLSTINLDTLREMRGDPAQYQSARDYLMAIKAHLGPRLKIIKAKAKVTTVADIEAQLELLRLEEGWVPDVEIWDYLNVMAPSKSLHDERRDQGVIVWDMKSHAEGESSSGVRRPIVATAIQSKAEALKKETLDENDAGKSIDIMQALDGCISINQTNQEYIDKVFRFGNLKARDTAKGSNVQVTCDLAWMCVDIRTYDFVWQGIHQVCSMGL